MNYKQLMVMAQVRPFLQQARFGLEKESQRVDFSGQLAQSNHPDVLGNRDFHPYIQTDFSETQMELITPVAETVSEVLRYLAAIHDVALRSMPENEMLWPLSMPPALPVSEEDIQIAKLDRFEDVLYRRHLAKEYGKRKQMVSGIHVNFEFAPALIQQLFQQQSEIVCLEAFKTDIYMKVARNFLHYRWLYTYLYGASPLSEANYFEPGQGPVEPVRSIRSSDYGYTNHKDVHVSYSSLQQYITDIEQLVHSGKLSEEKEFYAPIRLRGGQRMADLATAGIRYIELRSVDLNPFAELGIEEEQLEFLHLFMLYMLWADEEADADRWVSEGNEHNNLVALEHPLKSSQMQADGIAIIAEMKQMVQALQLPDSWLTSLSAIETQLREPDATLSGAWYKQTCVSSQKEAAVELARVYQAAAHEKPYQLAGYRTMELSTQLLLFDAIQKGIEVEVVDEEDQFLKLSADNHIEYVKNANMTSKDTYIAPLMMANKTVTKKVLDQAGFRVPAGAEFHSVVEALEAYPLFSNQAIVIKPKSTNYGLGISIFKDGADLEDYRTALSIAFSEDTAVLVETFMPGTEYRFFVLDGEVHAILQRIPANVVGDGRHTVRELVAFKNQDPLRGTHHRSPLELIQLGELEQLMLKEQGLTTETVPANNQMVYLRENSNISTGGDSIDVTDDFDDSYKAIAVDAVAALGAKISGIDLIVPDKHIPADVYADSYGIIEANFNPAMHMHIYPYQGTGRRLTLSVLAMLFPERVDSVNQ